MGLFHKKHYCSLCKQEIFGFSTILKINEKNNYKDKAFYEDRKAYICTTCHAKFCAKCLKFTNFHFMFLNEIEYCKFCNNISVEPMDG